LVLARCVGAQVLVVLLLAGCSAAPTIVHLPPPNLPLPQVSATSVGGVPLDPITTVEWHACESVANAIRSPVPCPALLPVPMPGSTTAMSCAAMSGLICGRPSITASANYLLINQYGFVVPSGYVGNLPGSGHFVVMAARDLNARADPALPPTPIPGYCAPVPESPPLVIHGNAASMFECGEDPGPSAPLADQYMETVSGHELIEWRQDGVTCQVSFHGHSTVNQNLALAVAQSTRMVVPPGQ